MAGSFNPELHQDFRSQSGSSLMSLKRHRMHHTEQRPSFYFDRGSICSGSRTERPANLSQDRTLNHSSSRIKGKVPERDYKASARIEAVVTVSGHYLVQVASVRPFCDMQMDHLTIIIDK